MNRENLLNSFVKRSCGRAIDVTEPFLQFYQLVLGVFIRSQRYGPSKELMSLLSVFLWKMFLNIAVFMDCATLVDKVLAYLSFRDLMTPLPPSMTFFLQLQVAVQFLSKDILSYGLGNMACSNFALLGTFLHEMAPFLESFCFTE